MTKQKEKKNKTKYLKLGIEKEYDIWHNETLEELQASEFFISMESPERKRFIEQLTEKRTARAIIGYNMYSSLVLEAEIIRNHSRYRAVDVEKPSKELTDCISIYNKKNRCECALCCSDWEKNTTISNTGCLSLAEPTGEVRNSQ